MRIKPHQQWSLILLAIWAWSYMGCAAYCESLERAAKQRLLEDHCIDNADTRAEAVECIDKARAQLEEEYPQ